MKNKPTIQLREGGFLTREMLSNPHADISLEERLVNSGAIDMGNNHTIVDLGNGYVRFVTIDPTKKRTKNSQ
jgi:hypothetical protein